MVKWMAVTTWATIAAVTLGYAHPDPALTTPAAPASASVTPAEARENATVGDETDHATKATRLKAAAFYLTCSRVLSEGHVWRAFGWARPRRPITRFDDSGVLCAVVVKRSSERPGTMTVSWPSGR